MITGLSLLGGLALLVVGAELTVRGAGSLGLRFGLSPLVVGLTIVAYGTSTPELVVSTQATLAGHDGIALANVVGSNICNVLLILGLASLIRPMKVDTRILRIEGPVLVGLTAGVCVLLLTVELGRVAGLVLLLALVGYTVWCVRLARAEPVAVESAGLAAPVTRSAWLDTALVVVGLGLLVAGGSLFVDGATAAALALGVAPAIVGLTAVAIGTSCPELATSVVAAVRGEGDMAIGNVVGSNMFNLSGVLGVAATVDPIGPGGVGTADFAVMGASAVVLMVFLLTQRRLDRWEGAVLLGGYAAYLYALLP